MATKALTANVAQIEMTIAEAFNALGERDALRLYEQLAERFSYSRGHDSIHAAVRTIAFDAAENEGWRGDDLAARYLEDPTRFGPSFQRAPMILIEGGR